MNTITAIQYVEFAIVILALFAVIVLQDRGLRRARAENREAIGLAKSTQILLEKSIDSRDAERQAWATERQQLLDRIQAPSFGELKQAEVRTIKAQNGVKEPPPMEQL